MHNSACTQHVSCQHDMQVHSIAYFIYRRIGLQHVCIDQWHGPYRHYNITWLSLHWMLDPAHVFAEPCRSPTLDCFHMLVLEHTLAAPVSAFNHDERGQACNNLLL